MRDGESRTKKILKPIVEELGKRYEIETIVLDGDDYQPVGRKMREAGEKRTQKTLQKVQKMGKTPPPPLPR